jgi:hypothetical protein
MRQIYKTFIRPSAIADSAGNKGSGHRRESCNMYNTIICAIVAVMLASTVVVAKPRDNQTNGQIKEQHCRQMVGVEKGEGEAGKSGTMRSQVQRWSECMIGMPS